MTTIEQIKAELERRLKDYWKICFHDVKAYNEDSNVRELKELLSFIHALEESEHLADIRKTSPNDLEEAAGEYEKKHTYQRYDGGGLTPEYDATLAESFIAGAKWQYQKDRAEFAKLKAKEWSDGYNEGIAKGKEQMMKEAVEGKIIFLLNGDVAINIGDTDEYKLGDKVRIIVKEKENEQSD